MTDLHTLTWFSLHNRLSLVRAAELTATGWYVSWQVETNGLPAAAQRFQDDSAYSMSAGADSRTPAVQLTHHFSAFWQTQCCLQNVSSVKKCGMSHRIGSCLYMAGSLYKWTCRFDLSLLSLQNTSLRKVS